MAELDKNFYPMPFPGGSSRISSVQSGNNTLETHEFYNELGKVVFYMKLLKSADKELIDFRLKVPNKPAKPIGTYKNYDSLT
jgi:hypothetical protein